MFETPAELNRVRVGQYDSAELRVLSVSLVNRPMAEEDRKRGGELGVGLRGDVKQK